ncbi:helix-turn-helix domain-containing protein [Vibrio vulnificus]|nr:helix-turn-helix domain-containing protein [Vibrio vulnificus]
MNFLNTNTPYAILPIEMLANPDFSPASKMIYMIMANDFPFYTKERGYYAPSNDRLALQTGLSLSTVKRALKDLKEAGLVTPVLERKKQATRYVVVALGKQKVQDNEETRQVTTEQEVPREEIIVESTETAPEPTETRANADIQPSASLGVTTPVEAPESISDRVQVDTGLFKVSFIPGVIFYEDNNYKAYSKALSDYAGSVLQPLSTLDNPF